MFAAEGQPESGSTALFDRAVEKAVIDAIIESVRAGLSGVCVMRGDAGMGKTRLLQYAADSATDLRHIWVVGVEAEAELGYAALHRLLRPFLALRDRLPPPQRDALGVAFGLRATGPADRFLVGLACLSLLADVATDRGLLCLIDDAHWIDRESLEALTFIGRRLSADKIGLLFGVREEEVSPGTFDGLPGLDIGGLPHDAALKLLYARVDAPVAADVARRLVTETSGCPLALTELATELTADQLRGGDLVSEPLPIGRRLEAHFLRRVRSLPSEAQMFLLVASAEASADPSLVRRAAAHLGAGLDAEDTVVVTGLLSVHPSVVFRHPLIRSAVYAGATAKERRAAHEALAGFIDRDTDPDRRAQHLALAASGTDEDLARELERAAVRAASRGGHSAESSFLVQAAQLTPDAQGRAARLLRAAAAALASGAVHRAETLLQQARSSLHDPLFQAEAIRLEGRLLALPTELAKPSLAPALLLAAARAFDPLDPKLARECLLEAMDAAFVSLRSTVGTTIEEIAQEALARRLPTSGQATLEDYLLDGASALFMSSYAEAIPVLRKAAEILRRGTVRREGIAKWLSFGLVMAHEMWDDETFMMWARHVERGARSNGALVALQQALVGSAKHETRSGRFAAAEGFYDEAVEVARAAGSDSAVAEMLKVDLYAWRGDSSRTRSAASVLREAGSLYGAGLVVCLADMALATLALGQGDYTEALAAAQRLDSLPGWTCQGLHVVVEAAVRAGHRDVALRNLETLTERTQATSTDWALGQLARSRALVADDDTAEPLYQEAIARLGNTTVATELAQSHLVYGEWMRRQKRRTDARTHLGRAYEMFESMGADAFAERTRRELAATGQKVTRQSARAGIDLTPQEAQVARLAAAGATKPEIAAKMFITTHTVDYHLRKVYRKLGISSRRQLRAWSRGND
jgi:DNA-binding CsgD family transcriptional regulator